MKKLNNKLLIPLLIVYFIINEYLFITFPFWMACIGMSITFVCCVIIYYLFETFFDEVKYYPPTKSTNLFQQYKDEYTIINGKYYCKECNEELFDEAKKPF